MTPPGGGPSSGWQGQGPEGIIELTVQGTRLMSRFRTPEVRIDGQQVRASYGVNRLPVPVGHHRVSARANWVTQYGKATYDVDVPQGQVVPVFYVLPLVPFPDGAMGPTKQKRAGKGQFVVFLTIVLVLVVVAIIFGAQGS